jgi:Ca2+-binding RTX toxin-like protein
MEMAHLGNFGLLAMLLLYTFDPFSWGEDDDDDLSQNDTDELEDPALPPISLTDDADTETGTDGDDSVLALGGNDTVNGGAGNDTIEGNTGDDVINGEDGNDRIAGGAGADTLFGGAGDDVLGVDRLDAAADYARGGEDHLNGGLGNDRLLFGDGDVVAGDEGFDVFDMVIDPDSEDLTVISDFDPTQDTLTLYLDEPVDGETPPEVTFETDFENDTSLVSLNGTQILRLDGITDLEEDDIQLAHISALEY